MIDSIDLTVVIPAYNGEGFISSAISSVLFQETSPREIIVVDDCSSDRTPAIVSAIANIETKVKYISLEKNSGGPAGPINHGIRLAKSKWIYVLDQDDLMAKDALTHFLKCLKGHPDAEVIGGMPDRFIDPNSSIKVSDSVLNYWPEKFPSEIGDVWLVTRDSLDFWLHNGMFLNGFPGFYFTKSAWRIVGGVDESYKIAADFDFVLRLATIYDIVVLKKMIYRYRYHGKNLSANKALMLREDLRAKEAAFLRADVTTQGTAKRTALEAVYKSYHWARNTHNYEAAYDALLKHKSLDGPILTRYRLHLYLRMHSIASYWSSYLLRKGRI